MGNLSPRQSKNFHGGFSSDLTLTPTRSSWKKQLQIINDTLNVKKMSLRHTHEKNKHYGMTIDENNHNLFSKKHFYDIAKNNCEKTNKKLSKKDQRQINVKKSFSLFSIKQPLADLTNIENLKEPVEQQEQQLVNNKMATVIQYRRMPEFELTTVTKRHSTFVPTVYHLPKPQSQFYHHFQIQLSSNNSTSNNNNHGLSSSTKHIRSLHPTTTKAQRTIIQASTSELLHCLSEYLCSSCSHLLPILDPLDCIVWIKSADRQLILQGWQEQVFVSPVNVVFVYLLVRDTLTYIVPSTTIKSVSELHSIVLTCLYLAFSYMGNEITYPLKPFVTDNETRDVFWKRVVLIMGQLSSKMLAINQNPKFFTECFSELKKYNLVQ
ncbi:unnamed protein product [Rotaria sp. Silwood2]|nr:unnamed protein product [Rotaria sp. Silwood2]CAF3868870.1 unnamed protein product [Rotaria sp. Silwood2]